MTTASRTSAPRRPPRACSTLIDWFKDGHIPKGAITWQEEQGRQAFQNGELIFHRNWGYVYNLAAKTDGSSKIVGKFDVAPLPGITVPGVSSLGGHNFAHRQERREQGHRAGLRQVHVHRRRAEVEALSRPRARRCSRRSTRDPGAGRRSSRSCPTQLKSIQGAKPRPKAVEYGDVTLAIQDAAYWRPPGADSHLMRPCSSTAGQVADSDQVVSRVSAIEIPVPAIGGCRELGCNRRRR